MEINEKMYEVEYEDNNEVEPEKKRTISCPRSVFVTIIFLTLVISIPILMFYFIIDQSQYYSRSYNYTCLIGNNYKVLCGRPNSTYLECLTNSCCYNFTAQSCYHHLPSQYFYKSYKSTFITSQNLTPFLNETIPEMNFAVKFIDKDKLQINLNSESIVPPETSIEEKTYYTKTFEGRLGIEVYRNKTNELLMSTLKGPLIASNGYWEWSFYLKNEQLFGFGEIILEKNKTISKVIYKNKDDHNTLPIFMAYLNGLFHGVYIESDGPLEVTILPSQLIILKSLSGNRITLNVCTGPTPKDVRKQQRYNNENNNPIKLPYWSLGVHVCRDGSITSIESAIKEYDDFVNRNKKSKIKIEFSSDCIHEALYSLLKEKDNVDLKNRIETLQVDSHFIMSVSPQIFIKNAGLYEAAVTLNVGYMTGNKKLYEGYYLKEKVIYPDFQHENINGWFEELKKYIPTQKFDGFVLKDNWPTDDSYTFRNEKYQFPYITKDINTTISNTIPWYAIAPSKNVEHIVKHNQYGASQVKAYMDNFNDPEFIITSSYDYGISKVAQIQNVDISWKNLKKAISTTLYHSMFGNPFITIPVCGSTDKFNEKLDELLCIRWYLTAATFPVFRISSDLPRRDPLSLPSIFAQRITSDAINQRFKLLPYYHTILSNSEPLVRPLFYDYHSDNETLILDEQYMLGDALLVAQPLKEPTYRLRLYLPPSAGTWYEYWGGQIAKSTGWIEISIIETDWIMYIAAGHIVPYRIIKSNTIGSYSQTDTLGVAIALKRYEDVYNAKGILKFNEAILNFEADKTQLIISTSDYVQLQEDIDCTNPKSIWPKVLEMATIYGINDLLTRSTFTSIDLCDLTTNEMKIPYFKQSQ